MLTFRIICSECGNDISCPVPIGLEDTTASYSCGNCGNELGVYLDDKFLNSNSLCESHLENFSK